MKAYERDMLAVRRALVSRLDAGQDVGEFLVAAIVEAQRYVDQRAARAERLASRRCDCGHSRDRHAQGSGQRHWTGAGVCGVRPYGHPCGCTAFYSDDPDLPGYLTANRPGSWEAAIIDEALRCGYTHDAHAV